jgi:competence protein ComFC
VQEFLAKIIACEVKVGYSRSNKQLLQYLVELCIEVIAPTFCCECSRRGLLLCDSCYKKIEFTPFPVVLTDSNSNQTELIKVVCTTAKYQEPISNLIKQMKFSGVIAICKYLAELTYYTQTLPEVDFFCFAPLHPKRKQERGFDQAEQLCKHLSKLTNTSYLPLLIRTKHLKPQSSILEKTNRIERLENCYQVNKKYLSFLNKLKQLNSVRQPVIGLVDDVFTTGATLQACAKAIHSINSKCSIIGICMARD